jgi:DnaJ-class molecular chaperone
MRIVLTTQCSACEGSGTRPRQQRRTAAGDRDPLDLVGRFPELCGKCGGSGRIADPATQPARPKAAGHVADIF